MRNNKPIISISMGDPAGIGPEIILKAFQNEEIFKECNPMVIGDAEVMRKCNEELGFGLNIHSITAVQDAQFNFGTLDVYDLHNVDLGKLVPGQVAAMAGNAAFEYIVKNIQLAMENEVDATVTAPIHKKALNDAGHHFSGHTEIYGHYTHTPNYAMLLADKHFRVIHVSTHVSLREACDLVKKERVVEVIRLLNGGLEQMGIKHGKIGVAGLNPHASDSGLFGDEEEKEIVPAIEQALKEGFQVEGPVPPDTFFAKAVSGFYDGCVAMYHDQGHIPFKLAGFQWDNEKKKMGVVTGVNITLGLPIIRTSVDHGTAFDIAWKNIASPDALLLAMDYAIKFAMNK